MGDTVRHFALFLVLAMTCTALAGRAEANTESFSHWLGGLRAEAKKEGISDATLKIALPDSLAPIPRVIELDRKQPEGTITFAQYQEKIVTRDRIDKGRAQWRDNMNALNDIGAHYGVDPQYIVALWGLETNYGKNAGSYDVVAALATLAYDGRRSKFFREELLKALKIIDSGDITHKDMKGSWAGAMGQTQFMPSSFFNFAEDYNRDGKRDIWNTRDDIFASAANYLARSGWQKGQPWGRKVDIPKGFSASLVGLDHKKRVEEWRALGVRLPGGAALPDDGATHASIVQPDGAGTQAYLVYDNYRVIMRWNKSTYFATSIGLLADAVKG